MTKIAGSGSICQRHGYAYPDTDPNQNVMDPQHWFVRYVMANGSSKILQQQQFFCSVPISEGSSSAAETEHIPPVEYACENIKCKNLELRKLMGEHSRDRTISLMPLTMRLQVCLSVNRLCKGTVSRDEYFVKAVPK